MSEDPSSDLLQKMILKGFKIPVVFNGFIDDWEMLSWTMDVWAEKLGEKMLPFRSGVRKTTKFPQWEGDCEKINLTLKNFIELENKCAEKKDNSYDSDCNRWLYFDYKYMNDCFENDQDILNSVTWRRFGFPERRGSDSTIWIGNDGAHTPCHMDTYGCNLVAQVYGRKQWILFPPERTAHLFPTRIPYEESSIYSNINFYSPDPNIANVLQEAYVVTLKPGDVLFVPNHWWHFVQNIGIAISVNSWIPLVSDEESRLEEALVRLFISQICKDLPENNCHRLLNPNEVDLIDCPLSVMMQQIEVCEERCKYKNLGSVKEEDENTIQVKKKAKLDENPESSSSDKVSDLNKISEEEFLHKFKDFVSAVPKYSLLELRNLLIEKYKSFPTQLMEDAVIHTAGNEQTEGSDDYRMRTVLNAFCHPEVISKIKDRILFQT